MSTKTKVTLNSDHVIKMFPVSFDRNKKYDRVLTEANMIDWIRGTIPNSSDPYNSPHSYVLSLDDGYGTSNGTDTKYIEFLIGGYYVKLSDSWLMVPIPENTKLTVIASISVNLANEALFARLEGKDDGKTFSALTIEVLSGNDVSSVTSTTNEIYRLKILETSASSSWVIPAGSRSILNVIDRGIIDGGIID